MSLNRNFWLFAVGRFVSQLGWAVQDVALPLYVLDKNPQWFDDDGFHSG